MKNLKQQLYKIQNGDTIVEVLLAIAIAAFAIGLSYATAQRSLQQSITAREHNEALNIMENQIADLKIRLQKTTDPTTFTNNFASKHHFCLDDSGADPVLTSSAWPALNNDGPNGPPSQTAPLAIKTSSGPYDQLCRHGTDVVYYADIDTSTSSATKDATLYHITVRWEKIGGGPVNQASLDYKLNGSTSRALAAVTQNPGNILPSCPLPSPNPISEKDPVLKLLSSAPSNQSFTYKFTDQPYTNLGNATPWKPNPTCTYTISIATRMRLPPSPPQNNEQMFIQFCNTASSCEYTSPLTPDINEPTSLSAITNPTFSHVFSGNDINYLKTEHCSIYPSGPPGCSTALNRIDAYDITVSGS
jgi:Tfp pilus assembly protein PilV